MVLQFCVKLHNKIDGHEYILEMAIFNICVQRAATLIEANKSYFFCVLSLLMVLYICVKFPNNISNGFQLTERTQVHGRNGYFQC